MSSPVAKRLRGIMGVNAYSSLVLLVRHYPLRADYLWRVMRNICDRLYFKIRR